MYVEETLWQLIVKSCQKRNPSLLNTQPPCLVKYKHFCKSPTSDHGVAGSNPARGEILSEPKRRFIAQSFSCSPFHRLEMTEILLKGRKTLTHPSIFLNDDPPLDYWKKANRSKLLRPYSMSRFCGIIFVIKITVTGMGKLARDTRAVQYGINYTWQNNLGIRIGLIRKMSTLKPVYLTLWNFIHFVTATKLRNAENLNLISWIVLEL